ncbi:hypothetical protein [Microbacterium sp. SORGH_AS_0888]|uniref:hypothetical protein n=1 Tax=Microbacterium sp. SORGH_AS_0888 TaxID=3041791 RepID=UPI0027D8BFCD|nr:hypothetical protein [Microbacterium sp. SORGH_AS_0888]
MRERVVRREIRADLAAAADDPHEAGLDQRCERASEDGHEGVLRRVDLEQRHPVAGQQLVEDVEHGDGADVAGAEHEADVGLVRGTQLTQARRADRVGGRDPRAQPDLAGEARQQQPIRRRRRIHVGTDAVARSRVDPYAVEGARPAGEGAKRAQVAVESAEHGVGSAQPLLAAQGVAHVEALGGRRRIHPVVDVRGDGRAHALQQRDPLAERDPRPHPCAAAERLDLALDPVGVRRLGGHGRAHGGLLRARAPA